MKGQYAAGFYANCLTENCSYRMHGYMVNSHHNIIIPSLKTKKRKIILFCNFFVTGCVVFGYSLLKIVIFIMKIITNYCINEFSISLQYDSMYYNSSWYNVTLIKLKCQIYSVNLHCSNVFCIHMRDWYAYFLRMYNQKN